MFSELILPKGCFESDSRSLYVINILILHPLASEELHLISPKVVILQAYLQ